MLSSMRVALLRPQLTLKRHRRGYTLLEAVLTLALGSILVLGMGFLVLAVREEMAVGMQIRTLEESCIAYANDFSKMLRNAEPNTVDLRRTNAPSEIAMNYMAPNDNRQVAPLYVYRLNTRDRMPELRSNGRLQDKYFEFMGHLDSRDHIRTLTNTYLISFCSNQRGQGLNSAWKKNYITLDFSVEYRRDPTWRGQQTLTKTLNFTSAAYLINNGWPGAKNVSN